jgi:hypothetical protein
MRFRSARARKYALIPVRNPPKTTPISGEIIWIASIEQINFYKVSELPHIFMTMNLFEPGPFDHAAGDPSKVTRATLLAMLPVRNRVRHVKIVSDPHLFYLNRGLS